MKKTIKLLAIILLPLAALCNGPRNNTFIVKLTTTGKHITKKMFLAYQIDGRKIIDSAAQVNGSYLFNGKSDRPTMATLVYDVDDMNLQQLMALTKRGARIPMLKFYLHQGNIEIITGDSLTHAEFKGSKINADDMLLKVQLADIENRQLNISRRLRAGADSAMASSLVKQLDSLALARKPILKTYINAHPESYVALMAMEEYAGAKPDLKTIEPMFMQLTPKVRATAAGKDYLQLLHKLTGLDSGIKAPSFTQANVAGKPVSLSSFKGKFVLLDFWASWCAPCRADNPKIVQLYHDFKDRNFTILGISLDAADGRADWIKAIKTDHLSWMQVSDLKHWSNALVKLYGINYIPQNFLIGPDGMIIARALNPEQLRAKLAEILPRNDNRHSH